MAEVQPSTSTVDINDLSTPQPPITILSNDVLTLIFEINSQEMALLSAPVYWENYDIALNIARVESQVCRRWRTLILDSPVVWGRCIYLDAFEDAKSEWWEEVLRRTQHSPLWILGRVFNSEFTEDSVVVTRNRFMQLLKLWERIQKINVVIHGQEISEDIQNTICCPAPILEVFEMHLPDLQKPLFLSTLVPGSTQRPLFANNAPAIHEINANKVAFRTDVPWLANLRHIALTPDSSVHVNPLELISRLPLLESVFLQSWDEDWSTLGKQSPTPAECSVRLPYLGVVRLSFSSLANCMTFLYHISPTKHFSLEVDVRDRTGLGLDDIALGRSEATPKEVLPRYISNYFSAHKSTSIFFLLHGDGFNLFDCTSLFDPDKRTFFKTKFYLGQDNPGTIASVTDAFVESTKLQPRLFDTVTRLDMYLEVDIHTSISRALRSFLYAFQSVEHLKISDGGIHFIAMLSLQPDSELNNDAANVLLPKIQTLEIADLHETPGRNAVDSLVALLNQRRSVGLPIMKVDFTSIVHSLRDLGVLDKVDGLEVVWKSGDQIASYICGSGNPERLRFTTV